MRKYHYSGIFKKFSNDNHERRRKLMTLIFLSIAYSIFSFLSNLYVFNENEICERFQFEIHFSKHISKSCSKKL